MKNNTVFEKIQKLFRIEEEEKNSLQNLSFEEICKNLAKLRFIKDDMYDSEYNVQFWNEFLKNPEWWYLPDLGSGVEVSKIWSVYEKGGYGPYSSDFYRISHRQIELIKTVEFQTLGDVYRFIEQIRKRQLEWKKRSEEAEKLPKIIY
jgi:hypothetical protein